jgi:Fe-S-cluster formation regulator IscX/YfhJ
MEAATKIAEELYDKFYKAIPSRLMHIDLHKELAVNLAIESAQSTIKVLEHIHEGMMSRTCEIGSDPTEVYQLWKKVETQLQIKKGGF